MSDLRVYNLKKKKVLKSSLITKEEVQNIIEENSKELLGLVVVCNNIKLTQKNNEILETLAYDEDYRLVVLEYRSGKFGSTINKGIVFLDYIRQNKGKIKLLLHEKLNDDELVNQINLNPRLISIGDDFNHYDEYAIKQLPYDIELVKYKIVDKDILVLEKSYHNFVDCETNFKNQSLYKRIDEFILSLGDEVAKSNFNNCISYRRIKNFLYIVEEDYLVIIIKQKDKYKKYIIKNDNDFNKITIAIEASYDEA